jgi:hypothetical protein
MAVVVVEIYLCVRGLYVVRVVNSPYPDTPSRMNLPHEIDYYHPIKSFLNSLNVCAGRPFVRISAF